MTNEELSTALEKAMVEIETLKSEVNRLKSSSDLEQRLPRTNLLSHSFLTRAFTVLGHYFVASLIIVIPIYILIFIFALVIGGLSGSF